MIQAKDAIKNSVTGERPPKGEAFLIVERSSGVMIAAYCREISGPSLEAA